MIVEPALGNRAAVCRRHVFRLRVELPEASTVQGSYRIEDAVAFPGPAVPLEQGLDLTLCILPGNETGVATASPRERPQQGDGLVELWQAIRSVYLEFGQQPFQAISRQFVAGLHGEAKAAQETANSRSHRR